MELAFDSTLSIHAGCVTQKASMQLSISMLVHDWILAAVPQFGTRLSTIGLLACLRAVVLHADPSILMHQATTHNQTLIFGLIFTELQRQTQSPLAHEAFYALASIIIFLDRCSSLLKQCKDEPNIKIFTQPLESTITIILRQLPWEHSFRACVLSCKQILDRCCSLTNQIIRRTLPASECDEAIAQHWTRVSATELHSLLDEDHELSSPTLASASHHNSVYYTLHALMPHLRAIDLMQQCPQLKSLLLSTAAFRPIFGLSNSILELLLSTLR